MKYLLFLVILIAGCAAIDRFLLPPSEPPGADSAVVEAVRSAAPTVDSFAPGYGEIALLLAIVAQNVYLGVRKFQSRDGVSPLP